MDDVISDFGLPALAMVGAVGLVTLAYHILRYAGRESRMARDLVHRAYRPSQAVAALVALSVALRLWADGDWRSATLHTLLLGIIGGSAWLVTALVNVLSEVALRRFRLETRDPLTARRIRTRVKVSHRVTLAFVSVMTVGVMLLTFEDVRTVGVSLLASAGVIGVIAALAAQSMLSNVLAGVQLAFGDALRLDDVVVVEGEWGRIEEITLRHVVVKIWDERRLILPTSYFTGHPFENWTKSERQLLGTVELDVDWSVPFDEMRAALRRILEDSDLWDGRACGLQVIDATGSLVRVRAVVSAADSTAQWNLRCWVREKLVEWLQQEHPTALPRVRTEFGGALVGGGDESPPRWVQHVPVGPRPRPHEPATVAAPGD